MHRVLAVFAILVLTDVARARAQYMTAVETVYDWTGPYIGGEAGGALGSSQTTIITQSSASPAFPPGTEQSSVHLRGLVGGVYTGYNHHFADGYVVGINFDVTSTGLSGSASDINPVNGVVGRQTVSLLWVSTLTARFGYPIDTWFPFVKAGWALGRFTASGSENDPTATPSLVNTFAGTHYRHGWTVGAGLEWAFSGPWVAKLEYDFTQFLDTRFAPLQVNVATGAVTFPERSATSFLHIVKVGLGYRF